jgi:hypothetical protein
MAGPKESVWSSSIWRLKPGPTKSILFIFVALFLLLPSWHSVLFPDPLLDHPVLLASKLLLKLQSQVKCYHYFIHFAD